MTPQECKKDFAIAIAKPKPYRLYVTPIVMVVLFIIAMSLLLTGPAWASSQACSVDGTVCVGGGPTPVAPKACGPVCRFVKYFRRDRR